VWQVQGARTDRGAAEMVGVLMLISIFVVVTAIIAVVLFSSPPPDKNPAVNLRITNESRLIKIYHAGGDPLQKDKIQIYVDGTLRTFNGFGTDNIWSLGEVLDYTAPVSDPMPNKIDIVYSDSPWHGTNSALIATLFFGALTNVQPDVMLYTISATAGTGGSISPSGAVQITPGTSVTFTITPNPGNTVADVLVDGVSAGAITTYTFTNVQTFHTISATFATSTYTITATAGSGGTISPSGAVQITPGTSATFTITPNTGNNVADVLVDGVTVGAITTYTFTNVQASHTIAASFAINTYTLTPTAGTGGTITPPSAVNVSYGSNQTFNITPNTGYSISGVLVDGGSVGAFTNYTFTNVTANHMINATFAINTYTITASSGANGTVTPSGVNTINYGATPIYTITPNPGYHVVNVLVNGTSVGAVTSYVFPSVTTNMTISATFAINTYTITVNYNSKGSVTTSPPATPVAVSDGGTVTVTYGSSQTFYFKANSNKKVISITDNGVTVYTGPSATGATITYIATNVIANHTLEGTFN
jgi:hypothetical protein